MSFRENELASKWAQLWLPNQLRSCGLGWVALSPGTHLVQTGELGTYASKRECKGPSVTEKGFAPAKAVGWILI